MAVARQAEGLLFSAERAIDDAISTVAKLTAFLPEARQEARLAAAIGHGTLVTILKAQKRMIQARQAMLDTHAGLDATRAALRLPETAFGGGDVKPIPPAQG